MTPMRSSSSRLGWGGSGAKWRTGSLPAMAATPTSIVSAVTTAAVRTPFAFIAGVEHKSAPYVSFCG